MSFRFDKIILFNEFDLILIAACSLQNVYQVNLISVNQETDYVIKNSTTHANLYYTLFLWAV